MTIQTLNSTFIPIKLGVKIILIPVAKIYQNILKFRASLMLEATSTSQSLKIL